MSVDRVLHLVLVTGLSGAGKSSTLKYLEDIGFHWTDNLPLPLIPAYLDRFRQEQQESTLKEPAKDNKRIVTRLAIGVHLRDRHCLTSFHHCCQELSAMLDRMELVFLEANVDTLVSRYRETRRRHPWAQACTVREAISLEMPYLEPIRAMADLIIETSRMTIPQLKEYLDQLFQEDRGKELDCTSVNDASLTVFLRSFGFKFGVSTDADMVLDGRFLPNPYYDPALRPFRGCDEPVVHFLEKDGEALDFLNRLQSLFDYLIPRYKREKKRYFTVDIGCTGGHHRSVFLVEQLGKRLSQQGFRVLMRHRDIDRESSQSSY